MEYIIDGKRFKLSYSELKEEYYKYASMCNEDFIANASKVLHLVCIIAYLKEIPNYLLLADTGLIHELSHIIDGTESVLSNEEIQTEFINLMKLA
jgi:hypothetical protein